MRWRNLYLMILWFSCTALLFKILGYLLPWWFVARVSGSTIDRFFIGIVFGLDCVAGISERNCTEYSIGRSPLQIEALVESSNMLVLQIAMSVNIGFLFIACMIIIGSAVTKMYNRGLMVLAVILVGISCVAYLVSLSFFIYIHINDIKETSMYEYNATNFPWSILIVSIGALFLFTTLVLMIISMCRWRDDDDVSLESYDERKIVEYPASEPRYVYENPKQYAMDRPMVQQQYVMDRPMVHHQPSARSYRYAVEAPQTQTVQYQEVGYPADTMYRPYTASARRY